jgi:alkanesulfonate monooxygenase SsuD/methylene tetrahydromethanopterin reductase-like flavin-dependent oxidoreductase (luciferase family)
MMTPFDPTRAPAGRLARLGVVIDPAEPSAVAIARFADLAGIDVVWVASLGTEGGSLADASVVATAILRARLGAIVATGGPPPAFANEITVDAGNETLNLARRLRDDTGGSAERPRFAAVAESQAEIAALLAVVDDVVLPAWRFPDLETAADEARAQAQEAGRDPATLGVAALVPVSIGRTSTEAEARAERDPRFARLGHPRDVGIFGTLEECQDRVIALAHAGISDLRCILPAAPDVHDVIAQLTAVTIGTTDVLVPGSLRSPAPPPPEGWGGRPEQPPRRGVSGGSRRRDGA